MPKWTKSKTLKNYYKTYPYRKDKNNPLYLDSKSYIEILRQYFLLLDEYLVAGNTYKPPYGMGEFRIVKFKPKDRVRNFNLERQNFKKTGEWKQIKFSNLHTNGERAMIKWFKSGYSHIPNRRIHKFTSSKTLRTMLRDTLLNKGNIEDYYNVGFVTRPHKFKTLI